jgi:hypothetical protein
MVFATGKRIKNPSGFVTYTSHAAHNGENGRSIVAAAEVFGDG